MISGHYFSDDIVKKVSDIASGSQLDHLKAERRKGTIPILLHLAGHKLPSPRSSKADDETRTNTVKTVQNKSICGGKAAI